MVSNMPAAASTVTASNVGMHPHPLLGDRRAERVGVERLLLRRVQPRRHVVDAVGGQQPPGVLAQHRDLVGDADGERVDRGSPTPS